jgi:hypothetical protein
MDGPGARTGGCLCGEVSYRITGPMRDIIACHCSQCRRTTGHYLAATAVRTKYFQLTRETGLRWRRASDTARRGFCSNCGSTLFWEPDSGTHISISAGTLDNTEGLKLVAHIFAGDKGSYYELEDGVQVHQGTSQGAVPLPD